MTTTGGGLPDPARLLAAVGQAVIVTDPAGTVMSWNAGAERLYGWSAQEAVGRPIGELTVPEVAQEDAEQIMVALRAGQTWSGSFTVRRKDGSSFRALVTNTGVDDEDGTTVAVVGVSIGLGDAVRPLLEHSIDAAVVIGTDGRVRYASPAITNVFGFHPGELEGDPVQGIVHADDWQAFARALEQNGDGVIPVEMRVRDSEGAWRWSEVVVTDLVGDPAVRGVVVNLRDVTERRTSHERLAHLALHDPLTGLPNRTLVADRIQHPLTRRGQAGALLFVDLDDFKNVNDRFGHSAGDDLLRTVAGRLLSTLRPEDTCGRLGGDEFIVLSEQVRGAPEACDVAERIQAALRLPVRVGSTTVTQTASVGLTLLAGRHRAHELLREADTAMYAAKAAGAGRYALFQGVGVDAQQPGGLVGRLRQALSDGELRVHFQPVVDLTSRSLYGVEALLRWQHPQRGLLVAEEFIDAAESSDLINDIGAFVLERACHQVGQWPGTELSVSVNVAARQLRDASLCDTVGRALAASGVGPQQLVLEITETGLLQDLATALEVLGTCRDLGIRVSIDDFGTGFAGFGYLRDLAVDEIKIDKSFVAGLGIEGSDTAIVGSILHLAHGLGLATTAEGVETIDQARRLQELGCDLGQGFYWSRAVVGRSRPPTVHESA